MKNKKILNPSLLAADFGNLDHELEELEKNGVNWLHLDIMDGIFVPNITFGPDQLKILRNHSKLFFDVHLMIEHPINFIDKFAEAGADSISFHVETKDNIDDCLEKIEEYGLKKGLVVSPGTPLEKVVPYLDKVDMILLMSVHPGFGGQKYIKSTTQKVLELKELIGDRDLLIEIDGGINNETINEALDAGVDIFVAGSAVFNGDIESNISELNHLLENN